MIVFGWLVLLVITIAACLATLLVFFAIIAGLLIWATSANFPFIVAVAS